MLDFLPPFLSQGVLPVGLGLLALAGCGWLLRRIGIPAGEVRMVIFTLLLAAFLVLTVIGAGLRGPGMVIQWPWEALP